MRADLWSRRIQPAIRLASTVVIFIFLLGRFQSQSKIGMPPSPKVDLTWTRSDGFHRSRELLAAEDQTSGAPEAEPLEASITGESRQVSEAAAVPLVEKNGTDFFGETVSCQEARAHPGYSDSCSFVKAHSSCKSGTVINYTLFFFCTCANAPMLGYGAFLVWLMALFYMLGNTAADYFCCSVERLSKALHLPPTLAGVTLLPFGNGAPDVFASIAAFMGAGAGQVGLNSVLGGAFFVSSVVAGSVSLAVATSDTNASELHRRSFVRDIIFFLITVACLVYILVLGSISFWGSLAYLGIYVLYSLAVGFVEWRRKVSSYKSKSANLQARQPLLTAQPTLPQWRWSPHVALFAQLGRGPHTGRPLWGWNEEEEEEEEDGRVWYSPRGLWWYLVEWPLALPRRLTIPLVETDRWSRFFGVASVTLAPLLFALVWDSKDNEPFMSSWKVYVGGTVVGVCFGIMAFFTTVADHPPRNFVLPWVLGGFVMSIMWFYVIANELVATLVALGVIWQLDASILGLTVLAWGNSVGDLMSNLSLASSGGDGVQIAIGGCYAGPMFNTLIGLGLSFALSAWKTYPAAFSIPSDRSLFYTLGFLVAGLVWSLLLLPYRRMQPSKTLGAGLLIIYFSFLTLRLADILGVVVL